MRLLYVLATWLVFTALFPVLALMRKTRDGLWQRFGFYPQGLLPAEGAPRLWLHGASAGDLLALAPMIERLRARFPHAKIVVSTMTNTGHAIATQRLRKSIDAVIYAPWDLFGSTRRAVAAVKPNLLVLEYTEIWPNLIRAAHVSGARIALTNGRFSANNLARYRTMFELIGNPLHDIDLFLMREDVEAERVLMLGAAKERVRVTGNTKFDALVPLAESAEDPTLRAALGLPANARVWIVGSTHEGEEELIFEAYKQLVVSAPDLHLVVAPRYLERVERVVQLARDANLHVGLRSRENPERAPVVVLDTIGELARAYRLATLVFVGGSFTTRGGQNILEPAAQGKPVLFGPHMENFHDSVQVLVGRGGIQVKDVEQLVRVASELLARPESLESLGSLARGAVRQISGASDRNVDALAALVQP
ncbi:MAG: 3-deoxy-D-manno-octulosonic acid transferase [Archangium gephyra]|uniref:3-deoxy-D-manno-octulosonic acid transferase n=1 Tax=Archangium gephyra TaxID=48 RepID=A0A2W5T4E8_9BACT|nr:MAG: 3-deoxy-D-manno-octulosonic acid transferase [Archangium gephyra]